MSKRTRRPWRTAWVCGAAAWLAGFATAVRADQRTATGTESAADAALAVAAATESEWIRIRRDDAGEPVAMEIATVRFVRPSQGAAQADEAYVDLIGCVHIADASYYVALQKQFESYDSLLFEMVRSEGTRELPGPGKRPAGLDGLSLLQTKLMPGMLGLVPQIGNVDYGPKNFVHADLTQEQLARKIRDRGDTGFSLFFKIYFELLGSQQKVLNERIRAAEARRAADPDKKPQEMSLATLLFTPQGALQLKRMMAEQMADLRSLAESETLTSLLIEDRNAAAVDVLKRRLDAGDRRIGVFYGAAHMPDFEKRLTDDLGLTKSDATWLTAWDLTKVPSQGGVPAVLKLLEEK